MKKNEFLQVIVTRNDGTIFNNDLTMSEQNLIVQILKENKSVNISIKKCSEEGYRLMFGK